MTSLKLTRSRDLKKYIDQVVSGSNMKCLTTIEGMEHAGFLTANLYGKSSFGEDALANVSIEERNGTIVGFVRIRAEKEGVAMSLGEKIAKSQK